MNAADKARALCKAARQYKAYSVHAGIVEKVFNRGMGSLALYRFGAGDRVTVNRGFERAGDRKRLLAMMPGAVIIDGALGYPDWYSKTLASPDA